MGKLLIYGSILKATPTKHLQPGPQHRCHLLSCILTKGDCSGSWDKGCCDAQHHQGVHGTHSSYWHLSEEPKPKGRTKPGWEQQQGLCWGNQSHSTAATLPWHTVTAMQSHIDRALVSQEVWLKDAHNKLPQPPKCPCSYHGVFTTSSRSLGTEAGRRKKVNQANIWSWG